MGSDRNIDNRLASLLPVLDDYTEWFTLATRKLFFPERYQDNLAITPPESFIVWVGQTFGDSSGKPASIHRLQALYTDMVKQTELLFSGLARGERPDFDLYDRFVILFEEFVQNIRRLEKDFLLDDSGFDPLTGLRSASVLEKDFHRETERLARQGKPFSLALMRIDTLEGIKSTGNQDQVDRCLVVTAELIRKSIRSFDDAYRLENDEFVLLLKQATISGGIRAMDRLKAALEKRAMEDQKIPLTLSSCIAEPIPGDALQDLLGNLRHDLSSEARESGSVLEYTELSPLQRYAKDAQ